MSVIRHATTPRKAEPSNITADHFSRRRRSRSKPLDGPLSDLRRDRLVLHLHRLGPRPVSELLKELLGTDAELQADALFLLEKYGALDPEIVRALDADSFPTAIFPVRVA